VDDAQRELAAITRRLPELVPNAYSDGFMKQYNFRVGVTPLKAEVLGPTVGRSLWILFGAVSLVLLIACANIANLFLVRMETRRRETAIRSALGARRADMAAHYLAESLLLTLSAGVAGVAFARWGIPALLAVAPRNIPRLSSASLSTTAIAFGLVLALLGGIVFGVLPLFRPSGDVDTLREGGRGLTHSHRQRRARTVLVVGQVAMAVVLMSAAGLLVRSFEQLRSVKPGLDPRGVLTFELALPYQSYGTMEEAANFHRALQERLAALPGVTAVGAADAVPLQDYGSGCTVVFREGRPYVDNEQTPCVHTLRFIPGYFRAMGITVNGRHPDWSDVDGRTQAAVVTQALANRLWPGEDPVGKGIGSNGPESKVWYRVVGVIPELHADGLDQSPTEAVFYPATSLRENDRNGQLTDMAYAIRTTLPDPMTLLPQVRRLVTAMSGEVPVLNPRLMSEVVARSVSTTSFIMLLLLLAGGMALLLSAVGIYGVVSYVVSLQRADIGVRMALGAQRAQVSRRVVAQSVGLAIVGTVIGVAAAVAGTRLLRSLLFGVSPTDPVVLSLAPLVLVAIAALAGLAPALRASRIDPVEAMRV
jgi:putative ABC transport system permease protein